jgi:hypothetical protein
VTLSQILFFGEVTPSMINKQNEEFEFEFMPKMKNVVIPVSGEKLHKFQGMCEMTNVTKRRMSKRD